VVGLAEVPPAAALRAAGKARGNRAKWRWDLLEPQGPRCAVMMRAPTRLQSS
jgi:hypothetical protein